MCGRFPSRYLKILGSFGVEKQSNLICFGGVLVAASRAHRWRHQQKLPNVISMCCQVGFQDKSLSVGFQQKSVPGEGFDLMFGREL